MSRGAVFHLSYLKLVTETCCECGTVFAMAEHFKEQRLSDRASFYCPAGHAQHYSGPTEADKLKKQLADAERAKAAADARARMAENNSKTHEKRAVKAERKLKRFSKGVCSECNRSFTNLQRHMEHQHPDVAK